MKRVCHITVIVLFFALQAAAQDRHGDVVVHSDPRLSVLMKKKKVIMLASVSKPVTHQSAEPRIAGVVTPHAAADAPPTVGGPSPGPMAKPMGETTHAAPVTSVESSHAVPAKAPVYIREKEGHVVYNGKGFRVQIYSGSDRNKAIMVKTEFMRHFPGVRTYLIYTSPSFRVKVGNYRNRAEAAGMLRQANGMYSPCVIVPDMITINSI